MSPSQVVIGFGPNYFHTMGGAAPTRLKHLLQQDETSSSKSPNKKDNEDAHGIGTTNGDADTDALMVQTYKFSSATLWDKEDDPIIQIACSSAASMFLTKNGKIYTCGTIHGKVQPSPIRKIIQLPLKCAEIAAGRHFCLARMEGGLAVCSWGAGHFGQLGQGDANPYCEQPTIMGGLLPRMTGSPVKQIAAGSWHGMAVTESGQVWGWGCNRSNQCGLKRQNTNSNAPPTILVPQLVPLQAKVVKVAGGRAHSVALDDKGEVYCWGASIYGQCAGQASRRKGGIAPPKLVEALAKVQIVDVSAGDTHTLALTGGGRVFAWGGGSEGQLGSGASIHLNPKPKLVGDLDFVAIEAGLEWKLQQKAKQANGTAASPGETSPKEEESLDDIPHTPSSEDSMTLPPFPTVERHLLSHVPKIVSIQSSGNYSVARSSSGHVYTWGCNDVGTLGLPIPNLDTLSVEDPANPPAKSTLRKLQFQTFDSCHNVALPQRVDCIPGYDITSCAVGPTHLWCLGVMRTKEGGNDANRTIGRTLYEVQEMRRHKSISKVRQRSKGGGDATTETEKLPDPPVVAQDEEMESLYENSQSLDADDVLPIAVLDKEKGKRRFGPMQLIKKLGRTPQSARRSLQNDKSVQC
jgi:alpha-tubulin suppressor-like RCC1 family protein